MSKKGGGFWNKPFGGIFDFNKDGKEDFGEQWIGFKILEECTKDEKDMNDYDSDHSSFDSDFDDDDTIDTSWRELCEDGSEFGIDPEDYENEEEYEEALNEAKENAGSVDVSFQITVECPALDALDEIKKADSILAANYLAHDAGFLYSQAIKDNFKLPVSLPDEDETPEYEFSQIIGKIAKRDIPLAFEVWSWSLDQFLPYAQYDEYAESELTNGVIDSMYDYPDHFRTELVRYMDKNPNFSQKIMGASKELADDLPELVYEALKDGLFRTAQALFKSGLKKAEDQWKAINKLTDRTINCCKKYDELEPIKSFKEHLFPLVKAIETGMVQDEIAEWEQDIDKYIAHQEAFRDVLNARLEKKRHKAREERLRQRQNYVNPQDPKLTDDKNIYIICGVIFPHAVKPYHYRTDGGSIKIGDTVLVPVCDKETTGTVVSVGQYMRIAAPFPVDRTKFIIRKIPDETE